MLNIYFTTELLQVGDYSPRSVKENVFCLRSDYLVKYSKTNRPILFIKEQMVNILSFVCIFVGVCVCVF
jgi:hypothetical protein